MKPFTMISIFVFSLIAILQLTRFVLGWEISINGVTIPVWVSAIAFIVSAGLAVMLWRESRTSATGQVLNVD
jgi:ABC-type methionine transport system permease subunit